MTRINFDADKLVFTGDHKKSVFLPNPYMCGNYKLQFSDKTMIEIIMKGAGNIEKIKVIKKGELFCFSEDRYISFYDGLESWNFC